MENEADVWVYHDKKIRGIGSSEELEFNGCTISYHTVCSLCM